MKHEKFSIEVKDRKSFVGKKFMAQAINNCPEGKIPMVVVHVTGDSQDNNMVIVRMKDWKGLFNE